MTERLSAGATAPDFTTRTLEGAPLSLASLRGRPVWLAFFRFASCPLCNLRVHELVTEGARFSQAGLATVAVFASREESLRPFAAQHRPWFTLVPDPEEALYARFHVGASWLGMVAPSVLAKGREARAQGYLPSARAEGTPNRLPADFLLDREGVVRLAHRGRTIADHVPLAEVDAFLARYGSGAAR